MATISMEVDIDMSDICLSDLIDEVKRRYKKGRINKSQLMAIIYDVDSENDSSPGMTLNEELKIEHLKKVIPYYTLEQIENLIPEAIR